MRLLAIILLAFFSLLGGVASYNFISGHDPNAIPSVLISQTVPAFDLPAVAGTGSPGLSQADLQDLGEVALVNVFASWCAPCRAEHPVLTRLTEETGIPLYGLNYKDKPEAAADWLEELGNPYVAIGADESGRAGIEWGVTGVPETFVIGRDGTILYREAGPVVGDGMKRLREAIAAAEAAS